LKVQLVNCQVSQYLNPLGIGLHSYIPNVVIFSIKDKEAACELLLI